MMVEVGVAELGPLLDDHVAGVAEDQDSGTCTTRARKEWYA